MKNDFEGISFSIPYEIAVVRPLKQTTLREREAVLREAHYNTELIPQEMIYVDLKTDSGVSSFSTGQVATAMGAAVLETTPEMAAEGNQGVALPLRQVPGAFWLSLRRAVHARAGGGAHLG